MKTLSSFFNPAAHRPLCQFPVPVKIWLTDHGAPRDSPGVSTSPHKESQPTARPPNSTSPRCPFDIPECGQPALQRSRSLLGIPHIGANTLRAAGLLLFDHSRQTPTSVVPVPIAPTAMATNLLDT
jgi:hypothetical protein